MIIEDPFEALIYAADAELQVALRVGDDVDERLRMILGDTPAISEATLRFRPPRSIKPVVEITLEGVGKGILDLIASFRTRMKDRFNNPGNSDDIETCIKGFELIYSGLENRYLSRVQADRVLGAIVTILVSVNEGTHGRMDGELRRAQELRQNILRLFEDSNDRERSELPT